MGKGVAETAQGDLPILPAYHSTEEILAHPRFPAARDALLRGMLSLYENRPFLNRLLLEVGRNVLFVVIMCLSACYDEADRETWPTLQLVKDAMAAFGLASSRRVADLVARLLKTGYLEQRSAPWDRRTRILAPTPKMLAQDQDWLVSHYIPLQVLFPNPGYAPIMQRDPTFQLQQRMVAASLMTQGAALLERNPLMLHFMRREAGIMILIKLMHGAGPAADTEREISYSDIGARFGVSRTQVRKLLQEAEETGLVHLIRRAGQFVRLTPKLIQSFDHFIADGMAGHDLIYKLARQAQADGSRSMQNVPLLVARSSSKTIIAPQVSE
jgi:DNA-binding MarR family transcriptional regulator